MASEDVTFAYKDHFYTAEALLSSWMNLSILILTTAMLFYHLARVGSVAADKRLAAFIAISLLGCGVMYMVVSLRNYMPRINDILHACKKDDNCPESQQQRIEITKQVNFWMTSITIAVELSIAYLIFDTL